MLVHAVLKALLFMVAGVIIHSCVGLLDALLVLTRVTLAGGIQVSCRLCVSGVSEHCY